MLKSPLSAGVSVSLDGSTEGHGVFSGDAEGPIIWEVLYRMELWVLVYVMVMMGTRIMTVVQQFLLSVPCFQLLSQPMENSRSNL